MTIKCNKYDGIKTVHTCLLCIHEYKCDLHKDSNEYQIHLQKQIKHKLKELKEVENNLKRYERIIGEIKNNKYNKSVNVYGNIQYYPKKNIFGVYIRKPEHVISGYNYYNLIEIKNELIESIRDLRMKQYKRCLYELC